MNKFKFGDKVWHELYGHGVYGKSFNLKTTELSQVMFESVGCINVLTSELTLATDWVKCSERMPEDGKCVLVMQHGNDSCAYLIIQATLFEGNFYPDSMDCCIDYSDRLDVTHWMPLPAPPMEISND